MSFQIWTCMLCCFSGKPVIGLLLGNVVIEDRRIQRVLHEPILDRLHDIGEVLELALIGPLALRLHVIRVGIGNIGHGAGIERGDRLRNHVLNRVLRQFDLDAGLGFELLDRLDQRVVFGAVEALAPPDRNRLLLRKCGCSGCEQPGRSDRQCDCANNLGSHVFLPQTAGVFNRSYKTLAHGRQPI
ncbi:hypothetical protein ABIF53_003315 [Bradyrhizobium japonicum]